MPADRSLLALFAVALSALVAAGVAGGGVGVGVWGPSHGPYGGEIVAVAVDPKNPRVVYAGSRGFGVFKSVDAGASWRAVNKGMEREFVHELVIDPTKPSTLYAGTIGTIVGGQDAVFKSTNGGRSWRLVRETRSWVEAMAIDPRRPATLYVATSIDGVLKTVDGGRSWRDVSRGLPSKYTRALAIDPRKTATLYVAHSRGVAKTTDGGRSWRAINAGIERRSVRVLAVDPSRPATVYAGTSEDENPGLFRSTNGGRTWRLLKEDFRADALAISLRTPSTLYAGDYRGVEVSRDGGRTWALVKETPSPVEALAVADGDAHAVYAGTWGSGLFKGTDDGRTWRDASTGVTALGVASLAIDPRSPATVYAAVNDANEEDLFQSTDAGRSWRAVDIWHAVDFGDSGPGASALAIGRGAIYVGTDGAGVFWSGDGGRTWRPGSGLDYWDDEAYVKTLVIDPRRPTTVYAGSSDDGTAGADGGMSKSTDGGKTWEAANTGLRGNAVLAIAIDPRRPATVYAGTWGGGVFKSTNGGRSWGPMTAGLGRRDVYALAVDPRRPATVYAGTPQGVFKSVDGGRLWKAASVGLGRKVVDAVLIDGGTLYAGTDEGVFRSEDGGRSWRSFNQGLRARNVNALAISPGGRLFAATSGGGVVARELPR